MSAIYNFSYEAARPAVSPAPLPSDVTGTITVPALAAAIKAHLDKARQYGGKSEQHYISAGLQLAELKAHFKQSPKADKTTWAEFVRQEFDLGQTRADELIRIATGKTTVAETRTTTAARVQKYAKAKKSALANAEMLPAPAAADLKPGALTYAGTLNKQLRVFTSELENFHADYLARVKVWCEEHRDIRYIGQLAHFLGQASDHLQTLSDEIEFRDLSRKNEAWQHDYLCTSHQTVTTSVAADSPEVTS